MPHESELCYTRRKSSYIVYFFFSPLLTFLKISHDLFIASQDKFSDNEEQNSLVIVFVFYFDLTASCYSYIQIRRELTNPLTLNRSELEMGFELLTPLTAISLWQKLLEVFYECIQTPTLR